MPKPTDKNTHEYITPNPLGNKRPWDEFYDMSYIKPIRTENIVEDGSIQILTEAEGIGNFVNDDDTVYYKHETRFDNGQLVDLNETRKVADKFIMNDPRYLDFLRSAFLKMRRNQRGYIKIGEVQHRRIYHKNNLQMQKTQEAMLKTLRHSAKLSWESPKLS